MDTGRRPPPRQRSRLFLSPSPWADIVPELVRLTEREPDAETLRVWDLVLQARRAPHRLERRQGQLLCPEALAERAVDEIVRYESENRAARIRDDALAQRLASPRRGAGRDWKTMLALLCLTLFQAMVERGGPPGLPLDIPFVELGMGDSTRMLLDGQWWRAVTALTLHADAGHLFSNVLFGGVFCLLLCRELGVGLGWALIVGCGAVGNCLNALARGPGHLSLGASTAVFAAVGILAGYRAFHGPGFSFRQSFVPLAAGATFLAFLGAAGENTDLGAHLFGFLVGMVAGCCTGFLAGRIGLPSPMVERLLGLVAALTPAIAWGRALLWRFF